MSVRRLFQWECDDDPCELVEKEGYGLPPGWKAYANTFTRRIHHFCPEHQADKRPPEWKDITERSS